MLGTKILREAFGPSAIKTAPPRLISGSIILNQSKCHEYVNLRWKNSFIYV